MGTVVKKANTIKKIGEKLVGKFKPMIRSRHPSHNPFRTQLRSLPFRSVIRFGSLTELDDAATTLGTRVELNSAEAIKNSSSKLLMKQCFEKLNVQTASWVAKTSSNAQAVDNWLKTVEYPIVAKSHHGSRGKGNTLLKSRADYDNFIKGKTLSHYIFEKYCNYNKEYRLHVTKDGCFYTCRKMLKQEFKDHPNSWQRHDDNCVWILEENPNFDKPVNWDTKGGIVENCVNALKSCGLDFGACDLRVQNNTDGDGKKRKSCEFIVVEINSAPSMGTVTLEKYKEKLPELLIEKYNARK